MFSPSTVNKVGRASGTILAHAASLVVDSEVVQFKIRKSTLGVVPAWHRRLKIPPDWVVKGVTSFEYAFAFGEFFINDGLLIFMFFGGEAEYVDILLSGMWVIIS